MNAHEMHVAMLKMVSATVAMTVGVGLTAGSLFVVVAALLQ